mmetsp:Transcript_117419/g.332260  ORF Transcript_117419/g.332260 Transcript_117419/m.332260 type:complete len:269 (+) Transcript_117419:131-937(+)
MDTLAHTAMRSDLRCKKTRFHIRITERRMFREPKWNSASEARAYSASSPSSGGSKSYSSSASRRHCSTVLVHKSSVAVRNSSAGLCALPRWRMGTCSPGSRVSASSSFCSSSTRSAAEAYNFDASCNEPHTRTADMSSSAARTAAPRSASAPLPQKPSTSGKPMEASSGVGASPAGGDSPRFRRYIKAERSPSAFSSAPLPSNTGSSCTALKTDLCRATIESSTDQHGRGNFFSSCAASAETALAMFTFSEREMLSEKLAPSSMQISL